MFFHFSKYPEKKSYDLKATKVVFGFIYPVKRDISISVINISIISLLLAIRVLKATLSKFQLFQEKSVTIGG